MSDLVYPDALDARLFHSVAAVAAYNAAVDAFLQQQTAAEYSTANNSRSNKRQSRRQRYENQE